MILKHVFIWFFIKSDVQKIGLYNTKYICSSDYDLFYKIFLDKNLIGESTTKDELIGVVQAGGFQANMVWKKLKEEIQIRIDNKQNVIFIFIILVNILLKKGSKNYLIILSRELKNLYFLFFSVILNPFLIISFFSLLFVKTIKIFS